MIKPNRMLSASVLTIGFLFLYIPIISLVVYSFNESKLVTVWSGFSLKWYGVLMHDDELLTAAWLSLKIALMTASASVVLGTWAGFVLARMGRFRGFTFFTAMINAPLVIPEVIQGISLLLLFVTMQQMFGWPAGRGLLTIWIGHVMLCVSFVAIIVQSRVKELDRSLEEAALDLGATPLKVFLAITLPLIVQALVSGWLLSFTVSIDDVILSAFLSGPGWTTLPLVVFSRVRMGLNPEMNAIATMFITVVTIGVVAANRVMLARERRLTRDVQMAERNADPARPHVGRSASAQRGGEAGRRSTI
ncbi:Inner membrane ABC transporter permease protein YdcV [Paraburkholderia domus]|jgi:ABC-type spermidine/putrescine transport system, permease component II|uniref:Inner membrane ABC transporter permease protein YdcV n=1 Tax=Paraburkholderia domus TaxID=2793075 RepID=A0A9N8R3X5_9BURK|nr:ABC transporter permease subunit [Paraburkholderia domus]MBK5053129.1 ABC transporter permease subunit [Burkholderia sp. R-70006]MBK5065080.1 ABC transporter permease subunit [Burkholderia sp. R-70199]MBK5090254.1 ABC transporter permease subunit [Burkholderia sp. R-69927]MBK5124757.1 ABC transporter permease subunit [Burkholderia sp. R-69980]MBK5169007.1 ABC transporter permease subunit [Burkholderia sp. R-70211]MBK5184212.1 ABC transporter permease subunit [Burkholderia sp. R-69749]